MRVLMFGRGVIATLYGRALDAAGHDVEFYVRPGRAAEYGDDVHLDWIDGRQKPFGRRRREVFRTSLRESLGPQDGFDLIVLSVGHHRLAEAAAFLAPRLGNATVLVFGNLWDEPLAAVRPIPAHQLVFGFPQAGGGFDADGTLSGAMMPSVVIGTTDEVPSGREQEVISAFQPTNLAVRRERDIRGWLWLHFAADAGMFMQAQQLGSMAEMVGNRRAMRQAFLTTGELLPVVAARGVDLEQHRSATLNYRQPRLMAAVTAAVTAALPLAQRSLAAHTDPATPEARAIVADTMREAHRFGVSLTSAGAQHRQCRATGRRSAKANRKLGLFSRTCLPRRTKLSS